MTAVTVTIRTEADRKLIQKWAQNVDLGTCVEFSEGKRSSDQNAKLWATLGEISRQVEWHGQYYPPETWKDLFMHALAGATFVPGIDGGMVPVGRHTSKLSKDQFSNLLEIINAWCVQHGLEMHHEAA